MSECGWKKEFGPGNVGNSAGGCGGEAAECGGRGPRLLADVGQLGTRVDEVLVVRRPREIRARTAVHEVGTDLFRVTHHLATPSDSDSDFEGHEACW